ncbi:MAG: hypothetical protein JWQ29_2908, partial [Phenylobacterium sp.]|nr:hypothetical protein [Phenylobacterium sp.]
MRILVVGASNSLLKGGYLDRATAILRRNLGADLEITNVSVGGTTTITGISRIFDLPAEARFDVVVHEYSMNDASHLNSRENGESIQFLALQLLIGVLAQRFPDALFAPVTFAMQPYFATGVRNRIHDAQKAIWAATGTPHLDVRQRLAYLFAQEAPAWLYSDPAHYSVPYGADLIGSIVARFLIEISRAEARQPLSELNANIRALPQARPIGLRHLSGEALAEHAHGHSELVVRTNSVMSVSALRLRPGGGVRLAERPFNIALLSDRRHDWARLTRGAGSQARSWALSTRFVGVDNPEANPTDKDRFFYSGIPLPLLLQPDEPFTQDTTAFDLSLEGSDAAAPSTLAFDGFQAPDLRPDPDRRLDIAGMTF